jgi:hypothetical protein
MSIFTPVMYKDISRMYNSDSSDSNSQYSESEYSELDSVVRSVIQKFVDRADFGKNKYGTDLDREDLTFLDWVVHAQEEHMDAILYLEKIRQLEIKRLTETSSHTDTWKVVAQCVAVFAAVVFYNCVMASYWNTPNVTYI